MSHSDVGCGNFSAQKQMRNGEISLCSMFDIEVKTAHSIPKKWDLLSTLF